MGPGGRTTWTSSWSSPTEARCLARCRTQNPGGGGNDNPGVTKVPLEIVTWVKRLCCRRHRSRSEDQSLLRQPESVHEVHRQGRLRQLQPRIRDELEYDQPRRGFGRRRAGGRCGRRARPRPRHARGRTARAVRSRSCSTTWASACPRPRSGRSRSWQLPTVSPRLSRGSSTFFGTSAAVPSAASIAAILRSSNPAASADEIERVMTDPVNAIDCTESALVPDPDCGAGFLLADSAFSALDITAPDTIINTGPTGTITTNQATFTFSGTPAADTAKIQCRIDSGPSPTALAEDLHRPYRRPPHRRLQSRGRSRKPGRDPGNPHLHASGLPTVIQPEGQDQQGQGKGPSQGQEGQEGHLQGEDTNAGNAGQGRQAQGQRRRQPQYLGRKDRRKQDEDRQAQAQTEEDRQGQLTFKVTSSNAGAKKVEKNVKVKKRARSRR